MVDLSKYVLELLMHFDCVIIPGFGGFISNPGSARISGAKQLISPPERSLAFNINLNQNDGLLCSFIAGKKEISYAEAVQLLQEAVRSFENTISQQQFYALEGIGVFYQKPNGTLEFKPDQLEHYSLDSYGLNMMQLIPIRRDTRVLKLKKEKTERSVYVITSRWVSWASAAAIVVLLGISFLINNKAVKSTDVILHSNETSLVPFVRADKYSKDIPFPQPVLKEVEAKIDTVFIGSIHNNNVTTSTPTTIENTNSSEKLYLLVAGVFKNENNALNYISDLKNKGVNATLERSVHNKTFKVIIGNYSSKEEAIQQLPEAKRINKDVWILTL